MRTRWLGVALLLAGGLAGCTAEEPDDPDAGPPPIDAAWQVPITDPTDEVMIAGDVVIVDDSAAPEHGVSFLDKNDGTELWRLSSVTGSIWVTSDAVVSHDADNNLTVQELDTGEKRFAVELESTAQVSDFALGFAVTEDHLITVDPLQGDDRTMTSIDMSDGETVWQKDFALDAESHFYLLQIQTPMPVDTVDSPYRRAAAPHLRPAADSDAVLATLSDFYDNVAVDGTGTFLVDAATGERGPTLDELLLPVADNYPRFTADGSVVTAPHNVDPYSETVCQWSSTVLTGDEDPVDRVIDTALPDCVAPQVTDTALFGSEDRYPTTVTVADGGSWRADTTGDAVFADGDIVWYRDDSGTVHAVDITSSTELWSGGELGDVNARCGELLVTGQPLGLQASVTALDVETGEQRWSLDATEPVDCDDDTVLLLTGDDGTGYRLFPRPTG